jgi:hypothetical protein
MGDGACVGTAREQDGKRKCIKINASESTSKMEQAKAHQRWSKRKHIKDGASESTSKM